MLYSPPIYRQKSPVMQQINTSIPARTDNTRRTIWVWAVMCTGTGILILTDIIYLLLALLPFYLNDMPARISANGGVLSPYDDVKTFPPFNWDAFGSIPNLIAIGAADLV